MSRGLMSIIVLNWNRLHYSKQTIECLVERTTVPHEFIFVDNNSAPESGVRDYLKKVKGNKHTKAIKHVFNDSNQGVAGGRNTGLLVADGDYLFNIDDDILVPENYDKFMKSACDNIPKLGVVGICVEPYKYPKKIINNVPVRVKSVGNINGAALCLPRRVFKRVGFFNNFNGLQAYGHEDSYLRYCLDHIGLISVYIPPKGVHLDKDADKAYRQAKNKAHAKKSPELSSLSGAIAKMRKTNSVFTPYIPLDVKKVEKAGRIVYDNDLILNDRKK